MSVIDNNKDLSPEEIARLRAVLSEEANNGAVTLSEEERKNIRKVIEIYELFLAGGKIAKGIVWLFLTLAGIATAWNQLGMTQRILGWLGGEG